MICLQDMENYDLLKGKAGELSCFLSPMRLCGVHVTGGRKTDYFYIQGLF